MILAQRRSSASNRVFLFASVPVLNKFKRRKFLKTKNLLTGETEADPEMIKVGLLAVRVVMSSTGHRIRNSATVKKKKRVCVSIAGRKSWSGGDHISLASQPHYQHG